MSQDQSELVKDAEETYFGMRFGLVMLILLLGCALAYQIWHSDQLCGSISGYYYTPVRPVFVGVLCAIGAGLIFYRARSNLENTALDIGGFSAFLVAFVPTAQPSTGSCTTSNVKDLQVEPLIATALPGLLIVGFLSLAIGFFVLRRPTGSSLLLSLFALVALVSASIVAVTSPSFLHPNDEHDFSAHQLAAIALFAAITVTVAINCFRSRAARSYCITYGALLVLMLGGLAFFFFADFRTHIFFTEAVGIGGFGVFWVIQTLQYRKDLPSR